MTNAPKVPNKSGGCFFLQNSLLTELIINLLVKCRWRTNGETYILIFYSYISVFHFSSRLVTISILIVAVGLYKNNENNIVNAFSLYNHSILILTKLFRHACYLPYVPLLIIPETCLL